MALVSVALVTAIATALFACSVAPSTSSSKGGPGPIPTGAPYVVLSSKAMSLHHCSVGEMKQGLVTRVARTALGLSLDEAQPRAVRCYGWTKVQSRNVPGAIGVMEPIPVLNLVPGARDTMSEVTRNDVTLSTPVVPQPRSVKPDWDPKSMKPEPEEVALLRVHLAQQLVEEVHQHALQGNPGPLVAALAVGPVTSTWDGWMVPTVVVEVRPVVPIAPHPHLQQARGGAMRTPGTVLPGAPTVPGAPPVLGATKPASNPGVGAVLAGVFLWGIMELSEDFEIRAGYDWYGWWVQRVPTGVLRVVRRINAHTHEELEQGAEVLQRNIQKWVTETHRAEKEGESEHQVMKQLGLLEDLLEPLRKALDFEPSWEDEEAWLAANKAAKKLLERAQEHHDDDACSQRVAGIPGRLEAAKKGFFEFHMEYNAHSASIEELEAFYNALVTGLAARMYLLCIEQALTTVAEQDEGYVLNLEKLMSSQVGEPGLRPVWKKNTVATVRSAHMNAPPPQHGFTLVNMPPLSNVDYLKYLLSGLI